MTPLSLLAALLPPPQPDLAIESLSLRHIYPGTLEQSPLKHPELLDGCWMAEILLDNNLRDDPEFGHPEPWRLEILAEDRVSVLGYVALEILTPSASSRSTLIHAWEREDPDLTQLLIATPEVWFGTSGRIAYLLDIWVEPLHRRMGLGSFLVQGVSMLLAEHDTLALYVWNDIEGSPISTLLPFFERTLGAYGFASKFRHPTPSGLFMVAGRASTPS